MKITVITVTLNNAATIGDTIASVMGQTHRDIEHIVIDGMSGDSSMEIIGEWQRREPRRIRVVQERDTGIYNAINKGLRLATGDVIGLLHGNDRFTSRDVLARVAGAFEHDPRQYLYGDIHYRRPGSERAVRRYSAREFTPAMLCHGIAPPHPTLYMRRRLLDITGPYKEDYLIAADFEMFVRLMLVHRLDGIYLPMDMVTMTTGGLSTRLYHRIVTNNREKMRALRENSIPVNPFSVLKRYLYGRKI